MNGIVEYSYALVRACLYLAEYTGSCPFDLYQHELARCRNCDNNAAVCWQKYFLGEGEGSEAI